MGSVCVCGGGGGVVLALHYAYGKVTAVICLGVEMWGEGGGGSSYALCLWQSYCSNVWEWGCGGGRG